MGGSNSIKTPIRTKSPEKLKPAGAACDYNIMFAEISFIHAGGEMYRNVKVVDWGCRYHTDSSGFGCK